MATLPKGHTGVAGPIRSKQDLYPNLQTEILLKGEIILPKNKSKSKKHNKASKTTIEPNRRQRKTHLDKNVNLFYEHNMQALKHNYPEIARTIRDTQISGKYQLMRWNEDTPATLVSPAQNFIYYEPTNPKQDAANQITALKLKNACLAVFLGLGLGYELNYYIDHMAAQQNTSNILVVEKDLEIFKLALMNEDLRTYLNHPKIHFVVGVEAGDLFSKLVPILHQDQIFMLARAMKPVYHSSALSLNKDYYMQVMKALREAMIFEVYNYGDSPEDSLIGIENMLINIDEIVSNPGINLLFDKFKGRPAVVVATGPSLNQNKHLLKGLEDKALIIAADASLKVLMDIGIKPHLVTALERVPDVAKFFEGFEPQEVQDVYLAACPVIRNEVYQAYPGPRVIVYRNLDHFKWLGVDKGILDIKLSAGNMAFKVAEALGCDPIILIGQDLALSRDGRTHADGNAYGEKQTYMLEGEFIEVMGNDGQPIPTTPDLYSFLKAYELDVAAYPGTCINATEGGAYIQGTQVMSFQEAIDCYISSDAFCPLEIIRHLEESFSGDEKKRDLELVLTLIRETEQDIYDILADCQQGVDICEMHQEMLERCLADVEYFNTMRSRLDELNVQILAPQERCKQRQRTYQLFLAHVFQSYYVKFTMDIAAIPGKYDDPDLARVEKLMRYVEWYRVIGGLVAICLKSLLKAKEKLEASINHHQ